MKQAQAVLKAQGTREYFENLIQTSSDSAVVQQAQTALSKVTIYPIEKVNEAREAIQQLSDAYGNFFMGNIGSISVLLSFFNNTTTSLSIQF